MAPAATPKIPTTTITQPLQTSTRPLQPTAYASDPHRLSFEENENMDSPIHYSRDPSRLIAYLVPFPEPTLIHEKTGRKPPARFLIYTPPPPPLVTPKEGEKEGKLHKVQRKWENEIREAKTNPQKVTSWKGAKGRVAKGVDKAMSWTKSSNLEFLNRVPNGKPNDELAAAHDEHSDDGVHEEDQTNSTVALREMVLIYPSTMSGTPEEIRAEFVENMMRTKSKAEKDAILATGLIPVAFGIDILLTLVWPFGGLGEIDSVWAYANIRGAKTARSVNKRLQSSGINPETKLMLTFTPSPRLEVLQQYLAAQCHEKDSKIFPQAVTCVVPNENQALQAIGWSPSQTGGVDKNWEDEQWETQEVKDDLHSVFKKSAKEWDKWCKKFEEDTEKALKKN